MQHTIVNNTDVKSPSETLLTPIEAWQSDQPVMLVLEGCEYPVRDINLYRIVAHNRRFGSVEFQDGDQPRIYYLSSHTSAINTPMFRVVGQAVR